MKLKTEHEIGKNEEIEVPNFEQLPTPIYDAKGSEVKKYFALGGAKYIEELGECLRQDWAPGVSMAYWKDGEKSNRARLRMRRKLVHDWSNEHGNTTPWREDFIIANLPDFLKYPAHLEIAHSEAGKIRTEQMHQAKAEKYKQKVHKELKTIGRIVTESVEPPKEPEEETITGGWSLGPSKYQKLGEQTKSSLTKMGDIRDGCRELWTALTEKEHMPSPNDDLIVDHIKPTREYRKFVYELDEREQTGLYNWLIFTEAAIKDMLNILDEAKDKK